MPEDCGQVPRDKSAGEAELPAPEGNLGDTEFSPRLDEPFFAFWDASRSRRGPSILRPRCSDSKNVFQRHRTHRCRIGPRSRSMHSMRSTCVSPCRAASRNAAQETIEVVYQETVPGMPDDLRIGPQRRRHDRDPIGHEQQGPVGRFDLVGERTACGDHGEIALRHDAADRFRAPRQGGLGMVGDCDELEVAEFILLEQLEQRLERRPVSAATHPADLEAPTDGTCELARSGRHQNSAGSGM